MHRKTNDDGVYVAVRWRDEIRVTRTRHTRRTDACAAVFGEARAEMEIAVVGGPGRVAKINKLDWRRLAPY